MKQGLDIAIPLTGRLILVLAPEALTLGLPLHTNLPTAVYRTPSSWSNHTIDITFERLGTESFLFMVETYRGSDRLTFKYDYMGRRVEKCVYSNTTLTSKTLFVYDGFKCVEELDGMNGNALSMLHTWQPFDVGLDVILATTDGNGTSYFLHDANKNVMENTSSSGSVLTSHVYAPFGLALSTIHAHIGFSSEYLDKQIVLGYYNFRNLGFKIGRWSSRDIISEIGSLNIYAFVNNKSIEKVDLLGLAKLVLTYDYADDSYFFERWFFMPGDTSSVLNISETKKDISSKIRHYHPEGKDPCDCIQHITFTGHSGIPGTITFGSGEQISADDIRRINNTLDEKRRKIYEQSIKNEQDFLNFVNGYLRKNAKVEFAECQSGGGDNGEILKEYLKTIFSPDVILVLYNTNIKWSYSGVIEVPEKCKNRIFLA